MWCHQFINNTIRVVGTQQRIRSWSPKWSNFSSWSNRSRVMTATRKNMAPLVCINRSKTRWKKEVTVYTNIRCLGLFSWAGEILTSVSEQLLFWTDHIFHLSNSYLCWSSPIACEEGTGTSNYHKIAVFKQKDSPVNEMIKMFYCTDTLMYKNKSLNSFKHTCIINRFWKIAW